MKRYLSTALAAACCLPAGSQAQSQALTIYGTIDMAARRASGLTAANAPSSSDSYAANSGVDATSKWGLRGSEDLGNGISALFNLESGISVDTGAQLNATKLWDRAALVGLAGHGARVTLGRQTVLLADTVIATDTLGLRFAAFNPNIALTALSAHGLGIEFGPAGSNAGSYRIDNSVKYTQAVGNFTGSAMYGFGEVSGNSSASSSKGLGLQYAAGELKLSGAWQTFRAADARKLDGWVAGANYTVGSVRLAATAGGHRADTSATARTQQRIYSAGATWAATSFVDITGAYYRVNRQRSNAVDDGYGRWFAFAEYKFSRRTKVFAEADLTQWRSGFQGVGNKSRATGTSLGISHMF